MKSSFVRAGYDLKSQRLETLDALGRGIQCDLRALDADSLRIVAIPVVALAFAHGVGTAM